MAARRAPVRPPTTASAAETAHYKNTVTDAMGHTLPEFLARVRLGLFMANPSLVDWLVRKCAENKFHHILNMVVPMTALQAHSATWATFHEHEQRDRTDYASWNGSREADFKADGSGISPDARVVMDDAMPMGATLARQTFLFHALPWAKELHDLAQRAGWGDFCRGFNDIAHVCSRAADMAGEGLELIYKASALENANDRNAEIARALNMLDQALAAGHWWPILHEALDDDANKETRVVRMWMFVPEEREDLNLQIRYLVRAQELIANKYIDITTEHAHFHNLPPNQKSREEQELRKKPDKIYVETILCRNPPRQPHWIRMFIACVADASSAPSVKPTMASEPLVGDTTMLDTIAPIREPFGGMLRCVWKAGVPSGGRIVIPTYDEDDDMDFFALVSRRLFDSAQSHMQRQRYAMNIDSTEAAAARAQSALNQHAERERQAQMQRRNVAEAAQEQHVAELRDAGLAPMGRDEDDEDGADYDGEAAPITFRRHVRRPLDLPTEHLAVYAEHDDWMDRPINEWARGNAHEMARDLVRFYAAQPLAEVPPQMAPQPRALVSPFYFFSPVAAFARHAYYGITPTQLNPLSYYKGVFNCVDPEYEKGLIERLEHLKDGRAAILFESMRVLHEKQHLEQIRNIRPADFWNLEFTLRTSEPYVTHVMRALRTRLLAMMEGEMDVALMTPDERRNYDTPKSISRYMTAAFSGFPHLDRVYCVSPRLAAPWNFQDLPRVDFIRSNEGLFWALGVSEIPTMIKRTWRLMGHTDAQMAQEFTRRMRAALQSIILAASLDTLRLAGAETAAAYANNLPPFPNMDRAASARIVAEGAVLSQQERASAASNARFASLFPTKTNIQFLNELVMTLNLTRETGALRHQTEPRQAEIEYIVGPRRVDEMISSANHIYQQIYGKLAQRSAYNAGTDSESTVDAGIIEFYRRESDIMNLRYWVQMLRQTSEAMCDLVSAEGEGDVSVEDRKRVRVLVSSFRMVINMIVRDAFYRTALDRRLLERRVGARLTSAVAEAMNWFVHQTANGDRDRNACYEANLFGNLSAGAQQIVYFGLYMGEVERLHASLGLSFVLLLTYTASHHYIQGTVGASKPNVLIAGTAATSKSITAIRTSSTLVPTTVQNTAYASSKAYVVDGILDGYRTITEEVGQAILGGNQGDNEQMTLFKQRLEASLIIARIFDTSDSARNEGRRDARVVYCSCQMTNVMCTNENLLGVDKAILSRCMVFVVGELDESSQAEGFKLNDQVMQAYSPDQIDAIADGAGRKLLRMHDFHAMLIYKMIQTFTIADVSMEDIRTLAAHIIAEAVSKAPKGGTGAVRMLGHIVRTIHSLVVRRAAGFCMQEGLVNAHKYYGAKMHMRDATAKSEPTFSYANRIPAVRPWSPEALFEIAPRYLYATKEDLLIALTALRDQLESPLTTSIIEFFATMLFQGKSLDRVHVLTEQRRVANGRQTTVEAIVDYNYLVVKPPPQVRSLQDVVRWVAESMVPPGGKRVGVEQLTLAMDLVLRSVRTLSKAEDNNRKGRIPKPDESEAGVAPVAPTADAEAARVAEMMAENERDAAATHVLAPPPAVVPAGTLPGGAGLSAPDFERLAGVGGGGPQQQNARQSNTAIGTMAASDAAKTRAAHKEPITEDQRVDEFFLVPGADGTISIACLYASMKPYFQRILSGTHTVTESRQNAASSLAASGFLQRAASQGGNSPTLHGSQEAQARAEQSASGATLEDRLNDSYPLRQADSAGSDMLKAIFNKLETSALDHYPDEVYKEIAKDLTVQHLFDAYEPLIKRCPTDVATTLLGLKRTDPLKPEHLKAFVESCPFDYLTLSCNTEAVGEKLKLHPKDNVPRSFRLFRTAQFKRQERSLVLTNQTRPLETSADLLSRGNRAARIQADARFSVVRTLEWDVDYVQMMRHADAMNVEVEFDAESVSTMYKTLPWAVKLYAVKGARETGRLRPTQSQHCYPTHVLKNIVDNYYAAQLHKGNADRKRAHSDMVNTSGFNNVT